ncbi:MAG: stage II sporulation protein M [Nanoarchaeota archaeon]|nr:stage II sporulation protein M [Nanoarchaeota archaeon]MCG2717307.1 stage II sporulation protein M [Nanoarchaeota archaeon]
MVLESLISPLSARRKPWELFFLGIFYSTIAMFLGLWIFYDQASLVMVFLTSLACVPLIYNTIKREEENEGAKKEVVLLKQHSRVVWFLTCLFLGFIISFSAWYVFLPGHMVENMFSTQMATISAINSKISGATNMDLLGGAAVGLKITGEITSGQLFWKILENNVKVLMFCIFFSFFYGAGAIFILTWNATVISAAIGNFVKTNIGALTGLTYFSMFSLGIARYMTHGIFEIVAYFVGGLAGGIISVAVIRRELKSKRFLHELLDSVDIILIAIGILFLAAFVEVYITPILF